MVWIQHPRAQLVKSNNGRVRDVRDNIDQFMWRKFGYKWKQLIRNGLIPRADIDAAHAEFKAMLDEQRAKLEGDSTDGKA